MPPTGRSRFQDAASTCSGLPHPPPAPAPLPKFQHRQCKGRHQPCGSGSVGDTNDHRTNRLGPRLPVTRSGTRLWTRVPTCWLGRGSAMGSLCAAWLLVACRLPPAVAAAGGNVPVSVCVGLRVVVGCPRRHLIAHQTCIPVLARMVFWWCVSLHSQWWSLQQSHSERRASSAIALPCNGPFPFHSGQALRARFRVPAAIIPARAHAK